MNIRSQLGLSFDDVLLIPKLGIVKSRTEVDTSTKFISKPIGSTQINIDIPLVMAPMSSVVNITMAKEMLRLGGGVILHRNQKVDEQILEFNCLRGNVGCAIGITEPLGDRFGRLYKSGCRLFCLDIAHGHSIYVERFLSDIPEKILQDVSFIFGSVATGEACEWFLERFSVGAFRVGIGAGAVCTTRTRTGHGYPQLTAISECAEAAKYAPIIADGGIKGAGDVVKSLAAGASSVMIGRLFAAAKEAPHPGEYYGMASERAKRESGCAREFTEGVEAKISVEGTLEEIVNKLMAGIKSGISYAGAIDIKGLQKNHEFIICSPGVEKESGVRV